MIKRNSGKKGNLPEKLGSTKDMLVQVFGLFPRLRRKNLVKDTKEKLGTEI